jgi:phosphatidylglycerol:prolipoprotein diacylglycerol transferase
VPLNVIVLEFDPILRIGEAEMRIETVGLAVVLVVTMFVAAFIARVTPAGDGLGPMRRGSHLRPDDVLFVTMGALPGAVLGGRLGYVLLHLDYYSVFPAFAIDPAYGSLELTLGVIGGVVTAGYVLRLLGAPIGRWAHVAIFPLLLALGAGKLVQVLGGDGQGLPTDAPWATLYAGDGPWGSLGSEIASHPSQVYEGIAVLVLLQVMTVLYARGVFRTPDGSAMLVGLFLWALIRFAVAFTWRDAPVVGPLRVEQLIALTLAAGCGAILVARWRAARQALAPGEVGEPLLAAMPAATEAVATLDGPSAAAVEAAVAGDAASAPAATEGTAAVEAAPPGPAVLAASDAPETRAAEAVAGPEGSVRTEVPATEAGGGATGPTGPTGHAEPSGDAAGEIEAPATARKWGRLGRLRRLVRAPGSGPRR